LPDRTRTAEVFPIAEVFSSAVAHITESDQEKVADLRAIKPSVMLIVGKVMDILTGAIGVSFIVDVVAIVGH